MPYANTRPDSPKGKVFEAYAVKGVEAATKLAEKLEITAARYNRWFKEWTAEGSKAGKGLPKASTAAKAKADKPAPKKVASPKKPAPKKVAVKKPRPTLRAPEQGNSGDDAQAAA